MLIGTIKASLEHGYYPPIIKQIFDYFAAMDLDQLTLGRHTFPFAADKMWFVILEYDKQPQADFLPEVHKYYSDLQIVLSGSETMAWALDSGAYEVAGEYNEVRDLLFYKVQTMPLNYLQAIPGNFYLFTPNTIHITNIDDGQTSAVRKLVVKIPNDLLLEK
ncbi:MAG: YhcH/YjgK/YiaL family protein [Psychromonas sp.]